MNANHLFIHKIEECSLKKDYGNAAKKINCKIFQSQFIQIFLFLMNFKVCKKKDNANNNYSSNHNSVKIKIRMLFQLKKFNFYLFPWFIRIEIY